MNEKTCKSCGKKINNDFNVCPYCGAKVEENFLNETISNNLENQKSEKSWVVCLLLLLFFGYIYIYKFYVGKVLEGFIAWIIGIASIIFLIIGYMAVMDGVGVFFIIILGLSLGFIYLAWIVIDFFALLIGKFKDKEGKYVVR
ncbi:zinc-ribbon domain-containing protein [Brachyspira catarrhinii]|uniref:Zinc-ribbon domain-containing protein n=1 Tax=Brachyspira catarrhinii TaxID=2528966 RepID=A0ABY2TTY8_9SPIR|nr:zinc-ribbon domain-containing protein [Brachyspira catarrhinii]TKZ36195.1 zinc-ribbon domain-containing protein [Brachyspira catarrhinii]